MGPAGRALAVLMCAGLGACASGNVKPPAPPDDQRISEAESMLDKAANAGAAEFAAQPLLEARHRVTAARNLLYRAAGDGDALSDAESARIGRLADAAYLDARLALVRTQAGAVQRKLDELTAELEQGGGNGQSEVSP